ncbi:MAG: hypothetical protein QME47_06545 [Candidatus Thermoplasmatota archaeon]|nr:hypothetical protein [Candidatus Thermoplasmatota archaeon]
MKECSIRGSVRGEYRIVQRGISTKELRETILKGAKTVKWNRIISRYKKLEVVWKKLPCLYFVIMTYWRE